ncbi:MAG: hypothetical protein AAGA21_03890 [Pseudomonadota bacterium]
MSAVETLRLAEESGVRVDVSGTDLVLQADHEPAGSLLDALRQHKNEIITWLSRTNTPWTADDWLTFYSERSKIAARSNVICPDKARAIAFDSCIAKWLEFCPERSDPGHCAECGGPDQQGHAVVPFGTEISGHTWLHPECWHAWNGRRRSQAIAALKTLGICPRVQFPDDFGKNGSL